MKFLLSVAVCLAVFSLSANARFMRSRISHNPDTVDELDLNKYVGLWYQMYADKIVYQTFEKDAYCATALYGDNGNSTISVHNYAAIGSPTGSPYVIDGYAYGSNPEEPGQLKVHFDSDDAAPFDAPYWVLELGPVNVDGLYDYAIVSDNLSLFLFVLARDPATFKAKYDAQVTATLTELGFVGYTAPIATYQESDCLYESANKKPAEKVKLGINPNPDTVDELVVSKYVGRWYQMYADKPVVSTFEKDGYCVTADYGDYGNGTLSVHNYMTVGSPTGPTSIIDGYAYGSNPEEPGQLLVHLDGGSPFDAPYWVLELGPENTDGLYDYAIVSDNLSLYLFVLARDPVVFKAKYDAEVTAKLVELGFEGYTAPIPTYQESDCVYESLKANSKLGALPDTVDTLDVNAYMGLWYQMYGDKFVFTTTSPDSYCATAKYTLLSNGSIGVHNHQTTGAPDGEVMTIDGYAYIPDASEPGKLSLHIEGVPQDGPYWILSLGPIANGLYEYAVVSDPFMLSLFILARDVDTYNAKYDAEVQALVKSLGFTKSYNSPVSLYQGTDCVYESAKK